MEDLRLLLLIACVGCGRLSFDLASNNVPPGGDSDGDGVPDFLDGEPGEVRLDVLPGTEVMLHDPDGVFLESIVVDASGRIVRVLAPGSLATVDSGTSRESIVLVPGDLVFPQRAQQFGAQLGSVTFGVPTFPGATHYRINSMLYSAPYTPPSTNHNVFEEHLAGGNLAAVFEARDASDEIIAHATVFSPFSDGTTYNPPWSTQTRAHPVEVTGAPSGVYVAVDVQLVYGGERIVSAWPGGYATADGNPLAFAFDLPDSSDEVIDSVSTLGPINGYAYRYTRTQVGPASYAYDFAHELDVDLAADTGEPGRPQLTWRRAPALAVADYAVVYVEWGNSNSDATWSIVVPAGMTSLRLPTIPASTYVPGVSPTGAIHWEVSYYDASWATGYFDLATERYTVIPPAGESMVFLYAGN